MLFECKVYDAKGKLKKTHTKKALEKRSTEKCRTMLPDHERKIIESFGDFRGGEDKSDMPVYSLLF